MCDQRGEWRNRSGSTPLDPASAEFTSAELGEARLTRRLIGIADAVAASPADSFPRAVSSNGELEGVCRFLGSDRVTPKAQESEDEPRLLLDALSS